MVTNEELKTAAKIYFRKWYWGNCNCFNLCAESMTVTTANH